MATSLILPSIFLLFSGPKSCVLVPRVADDEHSSVGGQDSVCLLWEVVVILPPSVTVAAPKGKRKYL